MSATIQIREPAWLREFKAFLMRGSVVELAVGLVVGAAFTTIVTSLVEDLINPLIGLMVGGVDFSNIFLVLSGERRASLEATREAGAVVLAIGKFFNTILKFVIVSFAIFWVVKALARLRLHEIGKAPPTTTPTEKLLAEIRDELRAQRSSASPPELKAPG
ncbi:large conductance mechanosensitive channel protein MscL [Roseicella aerolata]|uniref:Large-conductance mechanosensitive channel n=1 Tax=Roseicella aerolata TaxID=2883479 RepID=A0A9X1IF56_9PROT|nr:large conductance mechanosensitive channel protein MscL [Roseicella aerolata]MCB4823292.1 large conductance mechanosensitive channel protein MscL [Roseicella aerolata]